MIGVYPRLDDLPVFDAPDDRTRRTHVFVCWRPVAHLLMPHMTLVSAMITHSHDNRVAVREDVVNLGLPVRKRLVMRL